MEEKKEESMNEKAEEKVSKTGRPGWVKMRPEEIENIIVELAEQGETPAKIGLILRDKYGIPKARIFGKRIAQVLREKNIKYLTEKDIIDRKVGNLRKHVEKHKHDKQTPRALTKMLWALRKLEKRE
ncbi:30S ribosomal protein S15 [Candidatus Pacearchaeota archaeon]|nr:30S ribosomal protein S15 [Candidatus Pacearchaeota archaeon]